MFVSVEGLAVPEMMRFAALDEKRPWVSDPKFWRGGSGCSVLPLTVRLLLGG